MMKKNKYVLHSLSSIPNIEDFIPFSNLIDCLIFAYNHCIDFSVYILRSQHEFTFKISAFLNQLPDSVSETAFDQYFLGFVSLILTNHERDIFKKKLRSLKNV